ncbi:MAG: hypothetical protein HYW63_02770 [Candidatus Levybacteria bacterium]|nr:hypothetical protein [Candidatus Levybacteria bacterium]
MIEAGRRFLQKFRGAIEQPVNPHGTSASDVISSFIDSIYIGPSGEISHNLIIYWNGYRFGREVFLEIGRDGKKHPYSVYYFDMIDPNDLEGRIGFKADHPMIQPYYTSRSGRFDDFISDDTANIDYLTNESKEISEAINRFRRHGEKI